jgi:hypothetical protein
VNSLYFILQRIGIMNPMRRVRGPGLQAVGPVPSPGWFMETANRKGFQRMVSLRINEFVQIEYHTAHLLQRGALCIGL